MTTDFAAISKSGDRFAQRYRRFLEAVKTAKETRQEGACLYAHEEYRVLTDFLTEAQRSAGRHLTDFLTEAGRSARRHMLGLDHRG